MDREVAFWRIYPGDISAKHIRQLAERIDDHPKVGSGDQKLSVEEVDAFLAELDDPAFVESIGLGDNAGMLRIEGEMLRKQVSDALERGTGGSALEVAKGFGGRILAIPAYLWMIIAHAVGRAE